jgi:hypothetical protein
MKRLRILALIIFPALAVVGARSASSAPPSTAGCEQIVLRVHSGSAGYRVLLGTVAVPDERHTSRAAVRRHGQRWPYFRRVGIVVRGGASPVTITVPEGWRHRVAISWGNTPAVSSLRIASCGASESKPWNAYSGGFYLSSRADCVPLHLQVGGRSTSVRLGVGRTCGGTQRWMSPHAR